ncbi:MAG: hypothetical protein LBL66_00040 [Clostridiales bacterium]|jgi:hypothetical protein|nr:hypothetical protein [Clostridiales bacterium]
MPYVSCPPAGLLYGSKRGAAISAGQGNVSRFPAMRLVAKLTCGGLARLFAANFDKNFDSSVATIINFYLCLPQKSLAYHLAP